MSRTAQLGAQRPSLLDRIFSKIDDLLGVPRPRQEAKFQPSAVDQYGQGPTNTQACVNGLNNVVDGSGSKYSRQQQLVSNDGVRVKFLNSVRG